MGKNQTQSSYAVRFHLYDMFRLSKTVESEVSASGWEGEKDAEWTQCFSLGLWKRSPVRSCGFTKATKMESLKLSRAQCCCDTHS